MAKKAKHIEINYRPLHTSGSIEVVGSVPAKQVFQTISKEYAPDYTLTPLVLMPVCNAVDYDAVIKSGRVNASLINMRWFERIGTSRTLIASGNTNYSIVTEGANKGQITVKRNVNTIEPLTLEFHAEYLDTRTSQIFKYQMSMLVTASDAADTVPLLTIDSPTTLEWNPVREKNTQHTITAKAFIGMKEVTDKCNFFFYRETEDGLVQYTEDCDEWDFVSLTANALTIDMNYMGEGDTYVVKMSYDKDGSPSDTPDENLDAKHTTLVRFIPNLECDWEGVPTGVNGETKYIYPKPIVTDPKGILDVPEEMFRFFWSTKPKGATAYTRVADVKHPKIAVSDGMDLQLEVEDRGPLCYVMDGDNMVCIDGNPVVVRKNG